MGKPVQLPRENLVVYGLGGAFHWFHEIFMLRLGYRPDYLVDRNAQEGASCEGIPIINDLPSRIEATQRHRYTIVVCTGKERSFEQIRAQRIDEGFEHIVWIHQLYEIHDPFGLSQDTFTHADAGQADRIAAARTLFRDDLSLEIFDCFIETHRTKTPRTIPQSPPEEQYFPKDIDTEMPLGRLVFCGSDGDDLRRLARKIKSPIESLISFEPDPSIYAKTSNHETLTSWMGDISHVTRSLILSPCAVSATTSIRRFASANHPSIQRDHPTGFGSRLNPNGADMVQTITLDQALHGLEPTYICMDIEGEELNAVQGAKRIITAGRTRFAISAYHKVSHIWEIPNMIHSLNSNYQFFLRNYTGFCAETFLYMIPSNT